jgi:hypothetical protein
MFLMLTIVFCLTNDVQNWKQNRLDIADYTYNSEQPKLSCLDPRYAEKLAEVLYSIGKDLTSEKDVPTAIKWLERAYNAINNQPRTRDISRLHTCIIQTLVTSLLDDGKPGTISRAEDLVESIEVDIENKLLVSLLKLEILQNSHQEVFDRDTYTNILRDMVRGFLHNDMELKAILYHIRQLHSQCPRLAIMILDELITKIRDTDPQEWIEKLVIIHIWMTTNMKDPMTMIQITANILAGLSRPLDTEAAIAAQVVCWSSFASFMVKPVKLLVC